MLPSGTVWDVKRGRLITGLEALRLQGIEYDPANGPIPSNSQCQDLAGNALLAVESGLIFVHNP